MFVVAAVLIVVAIGPGSASDGSLRGGLRRGVVAAGPKWRGPVRPASPVTVPPGGGAPSQATVVASDIMSTSSPAASVASSNKVRPTTTSVGGGRSIRFDNLTTRNRSSGEVTPSAAAGNTIPSTVARKAASACRGLPAAASGLIPRQVFILWRVAEVSDLPANASRLHAQWIAQEPCWSRTIVSDADCHTLAELYGMADVLAWLPLNVMRADLCRILAIHRHGGVYMDLDVERRAPLDDIIQRGVQRAIKTTTTTTTTTSAVRRGETVALDHHGRDAALVTQKGVPALLLYGFETMQAVHSERPHYCNWFFAATPRHPALLTVAQTIALRCRHEAGLPAPPSVDHGVNATDAAARVERVALAAAALDPVFQRGGIDTIDLHMVHRLTGPEVFTAALDAYAADHLAAAQAYSPLPWNRPAWTDVEIREKLLIHHFASRAWGNATSEYPSWVFDRERLLRQEATAKGFVLPEVFNAAKKDDLFPRVALPPLHVRLVGPSAPGVRRVLDNNIQTASTQSDFTLLLRPGQPLRRIQCVTLYVGQPASTSLYQDVLSAQWTVAWRHDAKHLIASRQRSWRSVSLPITQYVVEVSDVAEKGDELVSEISFSRPQGTSVAEVLLFADSNCTRRYATTLFATEN